MLRSALRPLAALFAALMFLGLATVQAQSETANLPVRAVVSYANLLTPELAAELQPSYSEPDDFAFALVDRYVADATVCPATAAPIKLALTNGLLPFDAFVFYLADVLNGTTCAPSNLEIAMAQLNNAGVRYPLANAEGYITGETLNAALVQPLPVSGIASGIGADNGAYDDAISPTTGE